MKTVVKNLWLLSTILLFSFPPQVGAEQVPRCEPTEVALDPAALAKIDALVEQGLAENLLPGCVVCVGRHGKIVFLKAYGDKTIDTVFDLASVTKPVATATAIMILAQRNKLNIDDPVARYLTEFDIPDKRTITVRNLLTHVGGFPQGPGGDLNDAKKFKERLLNMKPESKPGERYVYSCASLIMLGEIVERISGQNLNEFTRDNIFRPLGMNDTCFVPNEELSRRAAVPTDFHANRKIGQVNDFQAFALGGIAGNAGLFSTAENLAVFAAMMLNEGESLGGTRILERKAVKEMTTANAVPGGFRGLGWSMQIGDAHRPKTMSPAAYGHGGWTGNAFWIDPKYDLFMIFLSNKPNRVVYPLASQIGDAVVESVTDKLNAFRGLTPPALFNTMKSSILKGTP
jgi:CubicO group peptidase (beta-lactamase class C family)